MSDLPDGRYWVRRVTRTTTTGSDGHGADGSGGGYWREQQTECRPLDLTSDGNHRTLRLGDLAFTVRTQPGGWMLLAPILSRSYPPLALPGHCTATVDVATAPIFRDPSSCKAVTSRVTQRCHGGTCGYDADAPFTLPACEAELATLAATAARLGEATHAEALRSLTRLERLARAGGKVWLSDPGEPDEPRCQPLTLSPGRDGEVALRQRVAIAGGGASIYQADVTLEPLFHRARYRSEYRRHTGGGASGIGPFETGLYLGRDVVLVGDRGWYFDRKTCEASP